MHLNPANQRVFEEQVELSYEHLFGREPETITYEHKDRYSLGTFRANVSLDEMFFYETQIQHPVFVYIPPQILVELENKNSEVLDEQREYVVSTICAPHRIVSIFQKKLFNKCEQPHAMKRAELAEEYPYSMFLCQIFIPVPEDPRDYHLSIGGNDEELLACMFSLEQYSSLKELN
jgi:hypothetical protein